MAFYKCQHATSALGAPIVCGIGTDSARQCGVNPCKHTVSFCDAHGGDAAQVDAIQKHMRVAHDKI